MKIILDEWHLVKNMNNLMRQAAAKEAERQADWGRIQFYQLSINAKKTEIIRKSLLRGIR